MNGSMATSINFNSKMRLIFEKEMIQLFSFDAQAVIYVDPMNVLSIMIPQICVN